MIKDVIGKLMEMSEDAAKCEYYDNDQASRRLKMTFVNLRDKEMKVLYRAIVALREEINSKYNQSKKQRKDEQSETV